MSALLKKIQVKDGAILLMFNNTIKCTILDFVMPRLTYLGSTSFCVAYCLILFFIPHLFLSSLSIRTSISLILSTLVARVIKLTVNRIRPFLMLSNLNINKIGIDNYSFPSGHTTSAFSVAIMFSIFFPISTFIVVPLACAVGISRMYLGVHYPTDVLVGMLLGICSSYLVYFL